MVEGKRRFLPFLREKRPTSSSRRGRKTRPFEIFLSSDGSDVRGTRRNRTGGGEVRNLWVVAFERNNRLVAIKSNMYIEERMYIARELAANVDTLVQNKCNVLLDD